MAGLLPCHWRLGLFPVAASLKVNSPDGLISKDEEDHDETKWISYFHRLKYSIGYQV